MIKKDSLPIVVTGIVLGVFGALLVKFGNPPNMGVCVACFLRDVAGALGLHHVEKLSYFRPEILGFTLGAFLIALITGDFKPSGGSSPILRFVTSAFVMIGALVFLGCPVRMVLRLAAGDPTAIVGFVGLIAGVLVGAILLKQGFSFGRTRKLSKWNGYVYPILTMGMLALVIIKPDFVHMTTKGHAPLWISLAVGLAVGALAQRSRFCMVGGFRNYTLVRDTYLLQGFFAFLISAFIINLFIGNFSWGAHPIAHTNILWNFMGMALVGIGSVMVGGCPLRQLILTSEGNTDSGMSVLGMIVGAGLAHNYLLAATPKGPHFNGEIATIAGIVLLLIIGTTNREI